MEGPTVHEGLFNELRKDAEFVEEYLTGPMSQLRVKIENMLLRAYQTGLRDGYAQGVHSNRQLPGVEG